MLLLMNQFHDLFEGFSGILCPTRGQHLSRCFRNLLIRRSLPANSTVHRTCLALARELSSAKMEPTKPRAFSIQQKFRFEISEIHEPNGSVHSGCTDPTQATSRIPRTWTISDSRVSCIKPWVLTVQRREYDLNGIPYRVHWMRKRLTAQHERLIPIIWSNICDCNTGLWSIIAGNVLIGLQSKIEEAKFNDVPAGNCDIPGTSAVLREVTWKIWSWKESTKSIKIFAGGTSCNKRKQTVI